MWNRQKHFFYMAVATTCFSSVQGKNHCDVWPGLLLLTMFSFGPTTNSLPANAGSLRCEIEDSQNFLCLSLSLQPWHSPANGTQTLRTCQLLFTDAETYLPMRTAFCRSVRDETAQHSLRCFLRKFFIAICVCVFVCSCPNGHVQPSCYTCLDYCANGQCSVDSRTLLPRCK